MKVPPCIIQAILFAGIRVDYNHKYLRCKKSDFLRILLSPPYLTFDQTEAFFFFSFFSLFVKLDVPRKFCVLFCRNDLPHETKTRVILTFELFEIFEIVRHCSHRRLINMHIFASSMISL